MRVCVTVTNKFTPLSAKQFIAKLSTVRCVCDPFFSVQSARSNFLSNWIVTLLDSSLEGKPIVYFPLFFSFLLEWGMNFIDKEIQKKSACVREQIYSLFFSPSESLFLQERAIHILEFLIETISVLNYAKTIVIFLCNLS